MLKRFLKWLGAPNVFPAVLVCIALLMVVLVFVVQHNEGDKVVTVQSLPVKLTPTPSVQASPNTITKTAVVQSGEALSTIFDQFHVPYNTLQAIMDLPKAKAHLLLIVPGQKIHFIFNLQKQLVGLTTSISLNQTLELSYTKAKQWQAQVVTKPYSIVLQYLHGQVHASLSRAMERAGLPVKLRNQLVGIFSERIHYRRDIKPGDTFSVLYQQYYLDGKPVKVGRIELATIITKHHLYQAIYYQDPKGHGGYYDQRGQNLKLGMERYPIKFDHISSPFTYRRLDPILHVYRPHLGVDLAANRGTPVHAVGPGYISFIGKKGGYGNAIMIHYGDHYVTLCGHMWKFAKGLHKGSRVHAGEVIGYVGSTGWSTGPHLHYGVFKDGTALNPVKMKLPDGAPVSSRYLYDFKMHAKLLLSQLQLHNEANI